MLARVFLSVVIIAFVSANDESRSIYETVQIIEAEGYMAEAHTVLTDDGYMLEMHRIPFKRNETSGSTYRPVVFIMHGLLSASNGFIALGPEYSIAYNLADAGFDVWLGNARGTRNSRRHKIWDPNHEEEKLDFFNFTWEQIGYYDIANMIDYILILTGNAKLHYVGHSQGGTVFLVLNSMRPEYQNKILSAHMLAGVGYMEHFPNTLLTGLAMFTNTIYTLALRLGIVELFPPINITDPRRTNDIDYEIQISEHFDHNCEMDEICRRVDLCTGDAGQKEMCELFGLEDIMSLRILDNPDLSVGGAALKQVAHYGQNVQDKKFRRWDYGPLENFQKYGSHLPPIYNISLITISTTMHYTVNDNLLDEQDVLAMCADMPNCVARKIARDSFLHVDFIAAGDVKELMTDYMIEQIEISHNSYIESLQPPSPEYGNTESDGSSILVPSVMTSFYISVMFIYLIF